MNTKKIDELTAVTEYFLFLAEKCKRKLTNKKLQKLLYYAQAWSLALTGQTIFNEPIEAWIHGPVVPSIYRRFKKYGFGLIEDAGSEDLLSLKGIKSVLDEVWRVYGKYDAGYLELLTHSEDPWIFARNDLDTKKASKAVISIDSMLHFYTTLLNKYSSNEPKK